MKELWWEKTVEYSYVGLMTQSHFICPLAGAHEKGGDAAASNDGFTWFLIEFKRTKNDFGSELAKFAICEDGTEPTFFSSIKTAVAEMRLQVACPRHEPHYFIYADGVVGTALSLLARPYWGSWASAGIQDLPAVTLARRTKLAGWEKWEFDCYLDSFLLAKSGGLSTVSAGSFSAVMGVAADSGHLVSMSLQEYAESQLGYTLEPILPNVVPAPAPPLSMFPKP